MKNIRLISLIGLILLLLAMFLLRLKQDSQTTATLQLNQAKVTDLTVSFDKTDKTTEVKVKNKDYQISFSQDAQNPTVEKSGETRYSRLPNGVKEEIILTKTPAAPFIAKYTATFSGVKPRFLNGLWRFFDDSGREQFFIPKPFMVDQKGQKSESIDLQINPISATQYQITVTPDHNWLTSPDRAYPVIVDPTIEVPDQPIQEIIAKRNQNSKTYSLPNGRFAWEGQIGPVHYKDSENNWQDIDTTWETTTSPWSYQMVKADFNTFLKSRFDAGMIARYQDPDTGEYVELQPQSLQYSNDLDQIQPIAIPQNVNATVSTDLAYWTGAYGAGRDFSWEVQTARLDKLLWLLNPASLPTPTATIRNGGNPVLELNLVIQRSAGVQIWIDGVLWDEQTNNDQQTSGLVEFRQVATGKVLWYINLPRTWDSAGEQVIGTFRFKRQGQALNVFHRIPLSWIEDSARVWPIKVDTTIDVQVGASSDDSARASNSSLSLTEVQFIAMNAAWGNYQSAARFTNITIPDGATIGTAYLTITCDNYGPYSSTVHRSDIYGEDNTSPATYSTDADYTGRTLTSTSVAWDGSGTWNPDVEYNSASIIPIIEELMGSYSYASGAAMAFRWLGARSDIGAQRAGYSYNGSTTKAPKLHIEYTAASPTPTSTPTPIPTPIMKFDGLKMEGIKVQ